MVLKYFGQALREIINPFVLRRTKDLLKATGRLKANKFEVTVWLQISPLQVLFVTMNRFTLVYALLSLISFYIFLCTDEAV